MIQIGWKLILVLIFISQSAFAYFDLSTGAHRLTSMNEISLADHPDFASAWHLVTVRYREDSGELRFTYANDIAWDAMKKMIPSYPDGAIFGKVGIKTETDPAFTSSKVPSGAKRFQLMVKDHVKYKDTNGWGYALFDGQGYLFDEDPKTSTQSCVACHRIVPQSDFVFSRPASLTLSDQSWTKISTAEAKVKFPFVEKNLLSLNKSIRSEMEPNTLTAYSLQGELQKHAFSGTFDEVVPLLEEQTKRMHAPSYLELDEKHFTLVTPQKTSKLCAVSELEVRILLVFNGRKVRDTAHCLKK